MTKHPEIPLQNIRAGDTICVEYKGYDTQVTITGVAHRRDFHDNWTTKSNMNLTNQLRTPAEKYFLVDRPKPALPKIKDSVIRVTKVNDELAYSGYLNFSKLAILDADGDWAIIMDDGVEYFQPDHILEWTNVNITDIED